MHKWAPQFGGCAVGLIALAACSPPAPSPPTASPSTSSSGAAVTSAVASPSPSSSAVSPSVLATEALTNIFCEPDSAGVWSFTGTLNNPSSTEVRYSVAIAVGATSSVAGHAIIEQTVGPNSKADVRADAFAKDAPAGAICEAVVSK